MWGNLPRMKARNKNRTCRECFGMGSREVTRVVNLAVRFEKEECAECGGHGER